MKKGVDPPKVPQYCRDCTLYSDPLESLRFFTIMEKRDFSVLIKHYVLPLKPLRKLKKISDVYWRLEASFCRYLSQMFTT